MLQVYYKKELDKMMVQMTVKYTIGTKVIKYV